jgi:DNA topoisomerase II
VYLLLPLLCDGTLHHRPGTYVDYSVDSMTYESFINDEFILFSMEDNKRSLPSMIDGFKPSQRKVLLAFFKRKLKAGIKVRTTQLVQYASTA